MRFAYYKDLSAADKKVYRQSDAIEVVRLARPRPLQPLAEALRVALATDDIGRVQVAVARLCDGVLADLGVAPVEVEVLAVRPKWEAAELHGLYTWEAGCPGRLQVWMRTAHHRRVVAFRTLLRTVLHELCHHLDFHHFPLGSSFHTEGFFKRESSLFHQLVPAAKPARKRSPAANRANAARARKVGGKQDKRKPARERAATGRAAQGKPARAKPVQGELRFARPRSEST